MGLSEPLCPTAERDAAGASDRIRLLSSREGRGQPDALPTRSMLLKPTSGTFPCWGWCPLLTSEVSGPMLWAIRVCLVRVPRNSPRTGFWHESFIWAVSPGDSRRGASRRGSDPEKGGSQRGMGWGVVTKQVHLGKDTEPRARSRPAPGEGAGRLHSSSACHPRGGESLAAPGLPPVCRQNGLWELRVLSAPGHSGSLPASLRPTRTPSSGFTSLVFISQGLNAAVLQPYLVLFHCVHLMPT